MAASSAPDSPLMPIALTIAGSDSGGNAGIQTDLLTFAANAVYGTTAITCLTAQNPDSITSIHPAPVEFVVEQAKQVVGYYQVKAAKTGMLFSREIIEAVANFFHYHPGILLVVDPVMVASSGQRLMQQDAIDSLTNSLLPLANLITPNLDEAEILLDRSLRTLEAMQEGAQELAARYHSGVLVKGGHLEGDELHDVLADTDGTLHHYTQDRIRDINTHGSGCTLSAAIAAHLARGLDPLEAAQQGRAFLRSGMEQALVLAGKRFINHFPK